VGASPARPLQKPAQCELPRRRILSAGGRPDGCETGQAWPRARLPASPCCNGAIACFRREDAEVSALVRAALEADGVRVLSTPSLQAFENGEALVKSGG